MKLYFDYDLLTTDEIRWGINRISYHKYKLLIMKHDITILNNC